MAKSKEKAKPKAKRLETGEDVIEALTEPVADRPELTACFPRLEEADHARRRFTLS